MSPFLSQNLSRQVQHALGPDVLERIIEREYSAKRYAGLLGGLLPRDYMPSLRTSSPTTRSTALCRFRL